MNRKFKIIVEKGLDGYFIGEVPELPGCYSQGKTVRELMKNMKEAIELYLETSQALNKKPQKRFFQIKEVVVNA
jgi:predicted RNase H-like HicB family nuclease